MDERPPRKDDANRQNVEAERPNEQPPFTGTSTDPLSTWGTGGSEDDRSGQRSNPRPAQPSADEEQSD